jgi:hypothetical protein
MGDWCYLVTEEATHFQFFIAVTPWTETVPLIIISEVLGEFPQISHTVLYKIITVRLDRLSQVLRKVGSENAHRCAQNTENRFDFDFFYSDITKMAMNFSITSYK